MVKNERGQTVVEYMLLMAVVISLVTTFYRSNLFKRYFGNNGAVGKAIKDSSEFAYRNAYIRDKPPGPYPDFYEVSQHPSYTPGGNETRFFGPRSAYGD